MRLFSVSEAGAEAGLPIVREPFPHVAVGEPGRGRIEARLGIGQRFLDSLPPAACPLVGKTLWEAACPRCGLARPGAEDWLHPAATMPPARLFEADVLRSRERGTLLLVEPSAGGADRRALVALRFACGYRGGVTYTAAEAIPCPDRGRGYPDYGYMVSSCQRCTTPLAEAEKPADEPASVQRWWVHPADAGEVYSGDTWPPEGVTVLATGQTGQGEAGRMGGGPEHLVVLQPGAMVRVRREGRLYGDDGRHIVEWDGETLTVTPWLDWTGRQAVAAGEEAGERL